MFSEGEIRTYQEIEQIIHSIEDFYGEIYQKSCSVIDIVKSSCDKLKCLNGRKQSIHTSSALCPMQVFQRVWETGATKICYPERELFVFEGIRGRMKQFLGQFKEIRKKIKVSQKQIMKLNDNLSSIKKLIKDYNDPTIYYNDIERIKDKKILSDKFQEYINKKKLLLSQKQDRQKTIQKLNQLYQWLNGQIEDCITKSINVFDKLGQGIIVIIRQFFFYTIDWTVKQIQKLQKMKTVDQQRKISIKSDEIISPDVAYQKCIHESKTIIKYKSEQLKLNQMTFMQIRVTIDGLNSIKKYLQKQMFQINHLKQKIFSICPDVNFFQFFRISLNSLINTYDSYINIFRGILQYYPSLQKLDFLKISTIGTLKKIISRQSNKPTQNISQLKYSLQRELRNIEEEQGSKILSQVLLHSMNKLYQQVRQIDLSLSSNQKSLQNKETVVSTFKILREQFKTNILVDLDFEKQVQSILEQPSLAEIDKQNADKVYSCALGSKILLSGKLKLYADAIGFQSVFNQKNLFFGTTYLMIPKSQIIEVTKETMLLVSNTIKVETKKGPLIFTSLFNRDKTYDEILCVLSGKKLSRTSSFQQVLVQSSEVTHAIQTPLDVEQLQCIKKKSSNYDKKLEQPRSISIFETKIQGISIRQYFKQICSENRIITHKKKQYKNFKQYILLNSQNSQLVIQTLTPPPPNYFQPNSQSKLSEVMNSQRVLKYKHQVQSVPIPFMPKFGYCIQKQVFEWVSDKLFVVQSQTLTSGIPYSDSIIVRNRTIIEQYQQGVKVNESVDIEFTKNISFQKIIRSSMQKQLKKGGIFIKDQIELFTQQFIAQKTKGEKQKPQSSTILNTSQEQSSNQNKYEQLVEDFNKKLSHIQFQNHRNLLLLSISFIIVLFLSKYI